MKTLRLLLTLSIFSLAFFTIDAQDIRTIVIEGYDNLQYSKEEIVAEPGERIKVVMKTISDQPKQTMALNWVLIKKDVNPREFALTASRHRDNGFITPGSEDKIIARTEMVGGGNQDAVTFTVPEKLGSYTYLCTFPGHYIAGMKGTLVVKE